MADNCSCIICIRHILVTRVKYDAYKNLGVSCEHDALATKSGCISAKTAKVIDEVGNKPDSWIDELKGFKSNQWGKSTSLTPLIG